MTLRQKLSRGAWTMICAGACMLALSCSGARRTVYVPGGAPVRLRKTIEDAPVWVMDENGEWAAGEIDLPEGWYVLADEESLSGVSASANVNVNDNSSTAADVSVHEEMRP